MIYLDTNVVLWLAAAPEQLSESAVQTINGAEILLISPMVELEIEYFYEVGRIQQAATVVLEHIRGAVNLRTCEKSFGSVVNAARDEVDSRSLRSTHHGAGFACRERAADTRQDHSRELLPGSLVGPRPRASAPRSPVPALPSHPFASR